MLFAFGLNGTGTRKTLFVVVVVVVANGARLDPAEK
jgi:hypothetical protein